MDHERREAEHGTVTRTYREDHEACAEAVRYALKLRARKPQPPTARAENPEEAR